MMSALMTYFDARDVLDLALLVVNGLLASAIFLVLLFSRSAPAQSPQAARWYERLARFVLVAAYGVLAVRVWAGWYFTPVEPTHVAVNAIVLGFVIAAHGDTSVIVMALRIARGTRRTLHGGAPPAPEDRPASG
ncbi:hypothetical protein [Paraburkholderia aspalathi]|uniref:hypothetical protein n=1 Tax=Paraburkholderia aspalathi TaxID=1324617 RepID=UPI0038BBD8B7